MYVRHLSRFTINVDTRIITARLHPDQKILKWAYHQTCINSQFELTKAEKAYVQKAQFVIFNKLLKIRILHRHSLNDTVHHQDIDSIMLELRIIYAVLVPVR